MFGKRKSKSPQSEQALLDDAVADLFKDQQRKERRKRRGRLRWPEWLDRRVVIALALILIAVVADAVRRENQEFYAIVTNFGGQVQARLTETSAPQPAALKQKLEDGATVLTGPGAWAELSFPDGSKVVMDGGSQLKVKLLEYSRGGRWRSRSFLLQAGRIYARVSENFGSGSELRVYTPACVAAARGTRFAVSADPAQNTARTVCGDGVVEVVGFNGERMFVRQTGDCSARAGQTPTLPVVASGAELRSFGHASLNEIVRPEPWYKLAELTMTQLLNAPLTLLGVGKCSWWAGSLDAARRSACVEGLRKIQVNLEGETSYPLWVNPATLAELHIVEEGGVAHILKNFDAAAIETYRSNGQRYQITVRARDRAKTRYELIATVIRKAANQD